MAARLSKSIAFCQLVFVLIIIVFVSVVVAVVEVAFFLFGLKLSRLSR